MATCNGPFRGIDYDARMSSSLFTETTDHVAEVVLRTPGKGNAMGPDFWRELPETFAALDGDPGVRAVVLRADGKHFTFGLDLASMMSELGPLAAAGSPARARSSTR